MIHLLSDIVAAAIAGWLASMYYNRASGFWVYVCMGLIGGIVGSFLFGLIGLHASGLIGNVIISTVGAVVTIWAVEKIRNR